MDRVMLFSLLYHLASTGLQASTYLARAKTELMAAVGGPLFPDWKHAKQWLATAEITAAVAIGYDWLYPHLSPAQRKAVRRALFDRGLYHYRRAYRCSNLGPAAPKDPDCTNPKLSYWWVASDSNWNTVSNSALVLALLALEPELNEPDVTQADRTLYKAVHDAALVALSKSPAKDASLRLGLKHLSGGGGWFEGPAYFNCGRDLAMLWVPGTSAHFNKSAAQLLAWAKQGGKPYFNKPVWQW